MPLSHLKSSPLHEPVCACVGGGRGGGGGGGWKGRDQWMIIVAI